MEWNTFYSDFNTGRIECHNVLQGIEQFIKKMRNKAGSRDEFSKELRSEMMYHYWGKAEWETIISPWCGRKDEDGMKVDIFWQLELNWERFVDYCWNFGRRK